MRLRLLFLYLILSAPIWTMDGDGPRFSDDEDEQSVHGRELAKITKGDSRIGTNDGIKIATRLSQIKTVREVKIPEDLGDITAAVEFLNDIEFDELATKPKTIEYLHKIHRLFSLCPTFTTLGGRKKLNDIAEHQGIVLDWSWNSFYKTLPSASWQARRDSRAVLNATMMGVFVVGGAVIIYAYNAVNNEIGSIAINNATLDSAGFDKGSCQICKQLWVYEYKTDDFKPVNYSNINLDCSELYELVGATAANISEACIEEIKQRFNIDEKNFYRAGCFRNGDFWFDKCNIDAIHNSLENAIKMQSKYFFPNIIGYGAIGISALSLCVVNVKDRCCALQHKAQSFYDYAVGKSSEAATKEPLNHHAFSDDDLNY